MDQHAEQADSANHAEALIPFAVSAAALLQAEAVSIETGLRTDNIEQRQRRFGPNQLQEAPPEPAWKKLVTQFKDLVIWILIVAAVVSGALGEWVDALAILAIVLLNGVIGFVQEQRAEQAMSALRKLSAPSAKVVRDGTHQTVPAGTLVPGDIIQVEAGNNIPADARLVQSFSLSVQEAALTGESVPGEKDADVVLAPDTPLGDRRNMVYMGTVAAAGKAPVTAIEVFKLISQRFASSHVRQNVGRML